MKAQTKAGWSHALTLALVATSIALLIGVLRTGGSATPPIAVEPYAIAESGHPAMADLRFDDAILAASKDPSKHNITVVYNIRDLIDVATAMQPKISRQDAVEEISRLIVETIAHASWLQNGGDAADCTAVGELLVINQAPRAHPEILDLLTALRRASRSQPATQPAMVSGVEPPIVQPLGERPGAVLKMVEKFQPDDGASYDSAIRALAEQMGIKIHVDWQSLGMVGAGDPAATASDALPIEHASVAQAIRRILVPDEDVESLSFRMAGDVVVVSIDWMTQVYNVRDLINVGAIHREKGYPEDELIAAITDSIDRYTWMDNGGTIGSIKRLSSGLLVVTQTRAGQVHVAEFLRKLRAANSEK